MTEGQTQVQLAPQTSLFTTARTCFALSLRARYVPFPHGFPHTPTAPTSPEESTVGKRRAGAGGHMAQVGIQLPCLFMVWPWASCLTFLCLCFPVRVSLSELQWRLAELKCVQHTNGVGKAAHPQVLCQPYHLIRLPAQHRHLHVAQATQTGTAKAELLPLPPKPALPHSRPPSAWHLCPSRSRSLTFWSHPGHLSLLHTSLPNHLQILIASLLNVPRIQPYLTTSCCLALANSLSLGASSSPLTGLCFCSCYDCLRLLEQEQLR